VRKHIVDTHNIEPSDYRTFGISSSPGTNSHVYACVHVCVCVPGRRQQLLYHLNTSGKYVAFKEQLKYSVVKIVREKYLKTTNFQDCDELQVSVISPVLDFDR